MVDEKMDPLRDKLQKMVKPTFEREGFELLDLVIKGNQLSKVLQFFIDKEGGVTVHDCAQLNRELSILLDSKDLGFDLVRLEVSSPGVDRPLKTKKDFQKNIGRDVSIYFFSGDEKKEEEGTIYQINNDSVSIKVDGQMVNVPFTSLIEAKIKLKW